MWLGCAIVVGMRATPAVPAQVEGETTQDTTSGGPIDDTIVVSGRQDRQFAGRDALSARPPVILMNDAWLARTKERISGGDPVLSAALARLLEEAGSALDGGPYSVVHKTNAPPSGDPHDYLSFGPYWWPDPSKEDGLPYIRRDGRINPETRTEASDSTRLDRMIHSVDALALAYYFSREEKYARHAALLVRTWFLNADTRMNPHLEYGQAIPGRVHGRGIGIIDTRGLTRVVDAVGLLAHSPAWTADDQAALEKWFRSYLDWLLTSEHGRDEQRQGNNHGTWYDVQVAAFALFVGDRELAGKVIESAKSKRIAAQIQPDGKQPRELGRTRSFDYSAMNLAGFFALARLGEHVGVDLWQFASPDGISIRAALDYLAPYADAGSEWPYEQITKPGRPRLLPLLLQAAMVYGAPEYQERIAQLPGERVGDHRSLLLYPAPSAEQDPRADTERPPR
jgi:hypothetical protein